VPDLPANKTWIVERSRLSFLYKSQLTSLNNSIKTQIVDYLSQTHPDVKTD